MIAGPEGSDAAGVPGPGGEGGWFAGGGGGGAYTTPHSAGDGGGPGGPYAGGGQGQDPAQTYWWNCWNWRWRRCGYANSVTSAPNGGSGIVILRYKIVPELQKQLVVLSVSMVAKPFILLLVLALLQQHQIGQR